MDAVTQKQQVCRHPQRASCSPFNYEIHVIRIHVSSKPAIPADAETITHISEHNEALILKATKCTGLLIGSMDTFELNEQMILHRLLTNPSEKTFGLNSANNRIFSLKHYIIKSPRSLF